MTPRTQAGGRPGHLAGRTVRAWRALHRDQRVAALFAIGLFVSMLLPWYVETVVFSTPAGHVAHDTLSAFGSFSFVEAAVLLVAGGVLVLLFARAEDRAFHLPGGDGWVITAAGVWAALLIFYRLLDTPATTHNLGGAVSNVGLEWGIFAALAGAIGLAWSGSRVRAAHHPEPPIVVAARTPRTPAPATGRARPGGGAGEPTQPTQPAARPAVPPTPAPNPLGQPKRRPQIDGQLSIEDPQE